MKNWKTYKLGELIEINKNSITKDFRFDIIEYLDTSSVTENRFAELQVIKLSDAPSRAKRIVKNDDIVYSTVRPNQKHFGIVKNAKPNTIASTGFAVITPTKIDPNFLYYYLAQNEIVGFLNGVAESNTTTFPAFNASLLETIDVTIPDSLKTQQSIASILSSLDNKIELNLQMNQTLEAMAQAIFKEWFVNFNLPGFDGRLVGGLPKGWRMGKISEVLEIKYGKDYKHLAEGDIPLYGSGGIMKYVNKAIYDGESILIPRKGTLSNLFYTDKPFWSVDTMFYSIVKGDAMGKYLFYLLKTLDLASMNVGSAVPSLTTQVLNNLLIKIPTTKVLEEFEKLITSFYEKTESNRNENESLVEIRDNLLPNLMTGKIEVKG